MTDEDNKITKESLENYEIKGEAFSEDKPNLAVWEYQNTSEDFGRCIMLNVDTLKNLQEADRKAIIAIMDHTVKSITMHYDLMPKDSKNDNKVTEEFREFLKAKIQ